MPSPVRGAAPPHAGTTPCADATLRPFYLFATSRPRPDPVGWWPNRLSLLLIGAVAVLAGWLLLSRPVRLLRSSLRNGLQDGR